MDYANLWTRIILRQKTLAEPCDIVQNSIARMLQGKYVSIKTIDKICNFFSIATIVILLHD